MQGMGDLGYPNCWNYLEVKCADHSVTTYQDRIKRKRWNNLPRKLILSDLRRTRLSLLKKRKKNIKNFCHQINDGRIWHWYIVRCLVICKFYLRLIITKINSPPVSLSKLSLCVGIATLKKKNSAWAQWLTIRSLWVCCLRSLSLLLNLKYLNLRTKIFHCRLLCGL